MVTEYINYNYEDYAYRIKVVHDFSKVHQLELSLLILTINLAKYIEKIIHTKKLN